MLVAAPGLADTQECAAAYEKAQELKQETNLRQARDQLLVCAQDSCPDFIKGDCGKWLGEVEAAMPSVVFVVRDADGNDIVDVTVKMGEDVLVEQLDGRAVNVNPGQQTFTFEIPGQDPVTKKVLITQGQKNRAVKIQLERDDPGEGEGGGATGEGDGATIDGGEVLEGTPNRTLAYIFGGVGGAGLISFAAFAAIGKSDENGLRDSCSPNCEDSQVDGVKKKYLIADVSLVLGIVSLGVGTYFFIKPPKSDAKAEAKVERTKPQLSFDVGATRRGGFATVLGRF